MKTEEQLGKAREKLREAAAVGDAMAELLRQDCPQGSRAIRERWHGLMGSIVRADLADGPAEPADYMEEFGTGNPEVPQ